MRPTRGHAPTRTSGPRPWRRNQPADRHRQANFKLAENTVNSSVGPVDPAAVADEQTIADTFLAAGVLTKKVDIAATYTDQLNDQIAAAIAKYKAQSARRLRRDDGALTPMASSATGPRTSRPVPTGRRRDTATSRTEKPPPAARTNRTRRRAAAARPRQAGRLRSRPSPQPRPARRVPGVALARSCRSCLSSSGSLAGIAGLWSTAVLPSPTDVAREFGTLIGNGQLLDNLLVSLRRVATAQPSASQSGPLLGVAVGLWRPVEQGIDAPLQMMRTIPFLIILPLFILWFGVDELPKVLIIAIGTALPMYLNTVLRRALGRSEAARDGRAVRPQPVAPDPAPSSSRERCRAS